MARNAVLFDLDGVLIDSEGVYFDFWDNIERLYPTGIPDFANYIKGSTLKRIMEYYTDPVVHADVLRRLKDQEESMRFVIFPGVIAFLDRLRQLGVPCAIVTSSNDSKMGRLFDQNPGFADYFEAIITDRQVARSKPDPEGYLLAAETLGCDAADCVVFEDSFAGLEAGKRSGARVIALATTNPAEALLKYIETVISSFDDITADSLFS